MSITLKKIDNYRWEVPISSKKGMHVFGIIYSSEDMLSMIEGDGSVEQMANAAMLPGIVKNSIAMPDIHVGYGLPIGGVVATDIHNGVVSPGAVGYDINCGVRLMRTNLRRRDIEGRVKKLVDDLFDYIPAGVGSMGRVKLSKKDERNLVIEGAGWVVRNGFGSQFDLDYIESFGCINEADPDKISAKAFERGSRQQGTLGSGNHFLEIQYVDEIYDTHAASVFGLDIGMITVMVHSGSRGLGHQVCTDYMEIIGRSMSRYGISMPDKQLACVPIESPEGRDYLAAMRGAANYAWGNRQFLMKFTEEVFMRSIGISKNNLGMSLIYDVAHNIIKIEDHIIKGKKRRLAVHRKGATRAFPAGHPKVPADYQQVGQPVIIPGDMGRASYVLVGGELSMKETFGSTCHGAGRVLSRKAAVKAAKGRDINRELEERGIYSRASCSRTMLEEMPDVYKDVSQVVDIVHNLGFSKKVALLKPLGVIKG